MAAAARLRGPDLTARSFRAGVSRHRLVGSIRVQEYLALLHRKIIRIAMSTDDARACDALIALSSIAAIASPPLRNVHRS
ncbi:hypothetical protein NLM16_28425 [Bradyrhizobium brasilense]|uniref:hypothetical protein n=1 Tax=Bradyrhizobium brasilense TaxID=1419277 RepID=UPI0028778A20|nr:hypothetical protein [Bradyrhizobium brasilense]MCP3418039.1 hypothetical protein [Bradyrhizobium brasilense]